MLSVIVYTGTREERAQWLPCQININAIACAFRLARGVAFINANGVWALPTDTALAFDNGDVFSVNIVIISTASQSLLLTGGFLRWEQ